MKKKATQKLSSRVRKTSAKTTTKTVEPKYKSPSDLAKGESMDYVFVLTVTRLARHASISDPGGNSFTVKEGELLGEFDHGGHQHRLQLFCK